MLKSKPQLNVALWEERDSDIWQCEKGNSYRLCFLRITEVFQVAFKPRVPFKTSPIISVTHKRISFAVYSFTEGMKFAKTAVFAKTDQQQNKNH